MRSLSCQPEDYLFFMDWKVITMNDRDDFTRHQGHNVYTFSAKDKGFGLIILLLIYVFAMPFAGLFIIFAGQTVKDRLLGVALLAWGTVLYMLIFR